MVKLAGGIPRFISLEPKANSFEFVSYVCEIFNLLAFQASHKGKTMSSSDWKLNSEELNSLFNAKTKAILFNNPNNPLGKVYTRDEMEEIANLCKKHNVLMISDDVYEHMVRATRSNSFRNKGGHFCTFVKRSLREAR